MQSLKGTLVYVMLDKPRACYDESKGSEFKSGIVITDEDVVDEFNELYPKQSAKKVKATDFEATYKCKLPEDAGKNVWVITLRKNTKLANGEALPEKYRPRVFQKKGGALVDVTASVLPANGSLGEISIDHYEGKMGNVARLRNVLVTELVEYQGGSNYEAGDEFADDGSATPAKIPAKAIEKAKSTPAKKAKPVEDEFDDSLPF